MRNDARTAGRPIDWVRTPHLHDVDRTATCWCGAKPGEPHTITPPRTEATPITALIAKWRACAQRDYRMAETDDRIQRGCVSTWTMVGRVWDEAANELAAAVSRLPPPERELRQMFVDGVTTARSYGARAYDLWGEQLERNFQNALARIRAGEFTVQAGVPLPADPPAPQAKIIADMQRANERVNEAKGVADYQACLIALALMARQFLRELPAPLPADPPGDAK